jgi:hypothetical protein
MMSAMSENKKEKTIKLYAYSEEDTSALILALARAGYKVWAVQEQFSMSSSWNVYFELK